MSLLSLWHDCGTLWLGALVRIIIRQAVSSYHRLKNWSTQEDVCLSVESLTHIRNPGYLKYKQERIRNVLEW
jgi:hypothetical protein